jgi:hypothetical protein
MLDEAADNLLKLRAVIDTTKIRVPASLNIITGSGMSYTRPDGVNVYRLHHWGNKRSSSKQRN